MKPQKHLITTRYLLLMAHLIILISILMARAENVKACLPYLYTIDQYNAKDIELIVGLSLGIAFISIELITFASGLTMFSSFPTIYSILAHALGAISLTYFAIYCWCCSLFWYIFAFTNCLPFFIDLLSILLDLCSFDMKYTYY